jgi:hypothetical protein
MSQFKDTPWPKTEAELVAYIREQTKAGGYDGTAEGAIRATLACFNYMASVLGLTGFQAGWCALQLVAEINSIDCPFGIVKAEDLLYPQYEGLEKVRGWFETWRRDWAPAEARKLLDKERGHEVHPDVRARWEELAALETRSNEVKTI